MRKSVTMLGYIMFFLPLLIDHKDRAYRFHANQSLVLLLVAGVISLVGLVIPVVGWFIILPLVAFISVVFVIIGMYNAYNEKMKELPVIGRIKLIKVGSI